MRARYELATTDQLQRLLALWKKGMPKKRIEQRFFKDSQSNGKGIGDAWRERLGVETQGVHRMVLRFNDLQAKAVQELELAAKQFEETGHTLIAIAFRAKAEEVRQA